MTMRRMCSSRKYSYPHPSPSHGGHFCFKSPPHWNFHSRGCLSYSPPPHLPIGIKIYQSELAQQRSCYLLKTHQSYQSVFVPVFLYAVTMLISILKELFQVKNGLTTSLLFFFENAKNFSRSDDTKRTKKKRMA